MRIKIVARVENPKELLKRMRERPDVIVRDAKTYKETLLVHMKGAYGVPELMGIRVFGEHDERAVVVHYGHDIRNQEENVLETGPKDEEIYKYSKLGYQPLGEFTATEIPFRYEEFEGKVIGFDRLGSFIVIERTFPGSDTDLFAEKQKKAVKFLVSLGIDPKNFLDVDVRGLILMLLLQAAQRGGNAPPS